MSHGPRYRRMQIRDHIAAERRYRIIDGLPTKRDAPRPEDGDPDA